MVATRELLPRLDPLSAEAVDDPYPRYAQLREAAALCRMGPASYGVTRYHDVVALARDPRLGSEFPPAYHAASLGTGAAAQFMSRIVLYRDPPAHSRLRRLLGAGMSPRLVRSLAPRIESLVAQLLDPALERGSLDAVDDLAFPLPVLVVCELLGVPPVDRDLVRPHAANLSRVFAAIVPEADRGVADESVGWLRDYLASQLDERRTRPGEDLLSALLAAEAGDDRLSPEEIVDNAVFSFFAGFETTSNLIAAGAAALLEHPAELAALRAEPALLPGAVEEFLRYDAPIQGTARFVREPVEVGGRPVRAGRVLVLLLGSANRDPRRFADPDRLDVRRSPNPHVSFGGGPHLCMGAALARLEATIAFRYLLDATSALEPAGPATRRRGTTFRTYDHVPVAVRAA